MKKRMSIILNSIEILILNLFTFNHQIFNYLLLIGKNSDEEHKAIRIRQYLNFFIIIVFIPLITIISQLIEFIYWGNEPDYSLFGYSLLFLFFLILFNITVYILFIHKISFFLNEGIIKNLFFFIIPVLLLFLGFTDFAFSSFVNSVYYLIIILSFSRKFKNSIKPIPNIFINNHINNLWSPNNFLRTKRFLVFFLVLYSMITFLFDFAMSIGQKIELPDDIIQLANINLYFDISLLMITLLTTLKNKISP